MQSQLIDDHFRLTVQEFWKNNPDLNEMSFIDLETTGLSPIVHEILEIGIVKITKDGTISTFEELVCPKKNISDENQRIHGISMQMVANASNIEEVLPRCLEFLGNSTLVGHNVQFDCGFIITQAQVQKLTLKGNKVFDTCLFSRQIAKKTNRHPLNHKLTTLAQLYIKNSDINRAHRALWDSLSSLKVFIALTNLLETKLEFKNIFEFKSFVYYMPASLNESDMDSKLRGMCEKDRNLLQLALEKSTPLMLSYQGGSHGEDFRPIRPIALLPRQKDLILHAECLLTHQMRNFKLKQIKSLKLDDTSHV